MSVFLVTWDLNRENANYAQARATFVKHLEAYENTRDQGLDSVRFISTSSASPAIATKSHWPCSTSTGSRRSTTITGTSWATS